MRYHPSTCIYSIIMVLQCIGETGTVKLSNVEGDITVDFGSAGTWTFSEMSLVKV